MKLLLSAAGRAALRAFVAALVTFGTGLLAAPDLNKTYLLGVVALVAAIAAALRAIQAYLVKTSFVAYLGDPYGEWLDAFLQAFVGSLVVTLSGWEGAPDLSTARSFAVAAIVGALNAAVRAVQGLLTQTEFPARDAGVNPPPHP